MYIIDLNSIEYNIEFIQDQRHSNHRSHFQKYHSNHHKNMIHKYIQYPRSYIPQWNYFYTTNNSTISNIFLPTSINNLNCSIPSNCISYIPIFVLNECGLLLCIFIMIYSICKISKPKTKRQIKNPPIIKA